MVLSVSTLIAIECNSCTTAFEAMGFIEVLRILAKIFDANERADTSGRQCKNNPYNWLLNEGARNHL